MAQPSVMLRLFGRPCVERQGMPALPLPAERRTLLLCTLALHGQWVPRSELAARLWPVLERERALANLRKALHLAREWPFASSIEATTDALRWAPPTDVQAFAEAQAQGRTADAVAWRRGPLLDGLDDLHNAAWTDWLQAERDQHARDWRAVVRAHCAQLVAEPAEAERFAREQLAADPLDEDAIVALLAAQRALQRFAEQRESFRAYAQRLEDELGVEPSLRVREQLWGASPGAAGGGQIGRDLEITALLALLAAGGPRVVTITGPGGVGKSTLLKAALRRFDSAEPVRWLALDDLHDALQAVARLCTELATLPQATETPQQAACRALAAGTRWLALDNCEHLPGLAPLVEQWLAAAPALRIVATSREPVGVTGERLFELRGLALPPPDADAAASLASDSVRLFVASARSVMPGFDGQRDATALAALVRSLGGLPLAILLAAHWVRRLDVADIGAELAHSLELLSSAEDGDERPEHRSVEATFARSWQRLAAHEQRALAALSVFPGSCTLAAAADVAATSLPVLAALADKSLVQFEPGGRLSLHPLLRRYAGMRQQRGDDAAAARHAGHYLRRLAHLNAAAGRGEPAAIGEIGLELENCRLAWRWAVEHRQVEALAEAVGALRHFFVVRAQLADGVALLESARLPEAPPTLLAPLETALAQLLHRCHEIEAAALAARRGISAARAIGRRDLLALCLSVRGLGEWQVGRPAEARRSLEQALAHARSAGDRRSIAAVQGNLALVERELGRLDRALEIMEEWLPAQQAAGEWLRVTLGLSNLGMIRMDLGRWADARATLAEGLRLCDSHGIEAPRTGLLVNLAETLVHLGALDEAEAHCARALQELARNARPEIEAQARNVMTHVALGRADLPLARVCVRDAAAAALHARLASARLEVVLCDALLLAAEGQHETARQRLGWYLKQPHLQALDRQRAEAALAALPRREPPRRRARRERFDLHTLVEGIAAGTRGTPSNA